MPLKAHCIRAFLKGNKETAETVGIPRARTVLRWIEQQQQNGAATMSGHRIWPDGMVTRVKLLLSGLAILYIEAPDVAVTKLIEGAFIIVPNTEACKHGWGGPDEFDNDGNFIGFGTCGVDVGEEEQQLIEILSDGNTTTITRDHTAPYYIYQTTNSLLRPHHFAVMNDWKGSDGTVIHWPALLPGRYTWPSEWGGQGTILVDEVEVNLVDNEYIFGVWKFNNRLVVAIYDGNPGYAVKSYAMDGTDPQTVAGSGFLPAGFELGQQLIASPSGAKAVSHNTLWANNSQAGNPGTGLYTYDFEDVERYLIELTADDGVPAKMTATADTKNLSNEPKAYHQQVRQHGELPVYPEWTIENVPSNGDDWLNPNEWDGPIESLWAGSGALAVVPGDAAWQLVWEEFVRPADFGSWIETPDPIGTPLPAVDYQIVTQNTYPGEEAPLEQLGVATATLGSTAIQSWRENQPPPITINIEGASWEYYIYAYAYTRTYNKTGGGVGIYTFNCREDTYINKVGGLYTYQYFLPIGYIVRQKIDRYHYLYVDDTRYLLGIDWNETTDAEGNPVEEMVECYLTGLGVNGPRPPIPPVLDEAFSPLWPTGVSQEEVLTTYPPRQNIHTDPPPVTTDPVTGDPVQDAYPDPIYYAGWYVRNTERYVTVVASGSERFIHENYEHPTDELTDKKMRVVSYSGGGTVWLVYDGEVSGEIDRHLFSEHIGFRNAGSNYALNAPYTEYCWPSGAYPGKWSDWPSDPESYDIDLDRRVAGFAGTTWNLSDIIPYQCSFSVGGMGGGGLINHSITWALDIRTRTWLRTRRSVQYSKEAMSAASDWGYSTDTVFPDYFENSTRVAISDNYCEVFHQGRLHELSHTRWAASYHDLVIGGIQTNLGGYPLWYVDPPGTPNYNVPVYANITTTVDGVTLAVAEIYDTTKTPAELEGFYGGVYRPLWELTLDQEPFEVYQTDPDWYTRTDDLKRDIYSEPEGMTSAVAILDNEGNLLAGIEDFMNATNLSSTDPNSSDPENPDPLFRNPNISPVRAVKVE